MAPLGERAQNREHTRASRVAVGRRHAVVEDDDLRVPLSVRGALGLARVLCTVLARKRVAPLLVKLLAVDDLKVFEAGARVRARGRALVVDESRARLIDDLEAERAHAPAAVPVLVVGRRVSSV